MFGMFGNPFEQQFPVNPFQSPFGGSQFQQPFGGSPFQQGGSPFQQGGLGWNPMQASMGFGGAPSMGSPFGGFGASPFGQQQGFGASPFGQQQAGGISPFGFPSSPYVNPSIIPQLAALIPHIAQHLAQLQRPEASSMGTPWAGAFGGGTPFGSPLNFQSQIDPLTSLMLAQSMGQQGPIRSLVGGSPFESQRAGMGGGISPMMGQSVDPYTLLLRAQALSQFANPLEQAFRGQQGMFGGGGFGSPFGAQRPVPFG